MSSASIVTMIVSRCPTTDGLLNNTNEIATDMKNKKKQKIATVSSLILGLTFGLPNLPAQADDVGTRCSWFGKNSTCLTVNTNSDLRVTRIYASFRIAASERCIPNWRYRISFWDAKNHEYRYYYTPTSRTCNKVGHFLDQEKPYYPAKVGKICAALYDFTNTYITHSCVPIP